MQGLQAPAPRPRPRREAFAVVRWCKGYRWLLALPSNAMSAAWMRLLQDVRSLLPAVGQLLLHPRAVRPCAKQCRQGRTPGQQRHVLRASRRRQGGACQS